MRAKIVFSNILAVLLICLFSYFYLNSSLTAESDQKLEKDLRVVSRLFDRSEALRGHEVLSEVRRLSLSKTVADVFTGIDSEKAEDETVKEYEHRLREEWFRKAVLAVDFVSDDMAKNIRKPAIVFVTDRQGVVLARNTTPNACPAGRKVADAIGVVKRALDGEASYALWSLDDSAFDKENRGKDHYLCSLMNTGLLEMSATPIWDSNEQVAGVVAVGFEVSNGVAAEKSKALGLDFAVLDSGSVYSSSFSGDAARQALNSGLSQEDIAELIKESQKKGIHSKLFKIAVQGETYMAVFAPVSYSDEKDEIGYLFMSSLKESRSFSSSLFMFLIISGVGILIIIIIGFVLANHFMKPVIAIEEGLLKIINGEYDYRLDVKSSEVGGLGYRINQLVNVFTEQEETSDEE